MANAASKSGKDNAPTQDELAQQIEVIREDIANLAALLRDAGEAKVDKVRAKAKDGVEEATHMAERLGAEANKLIETRPGMVLAVAAGLGFLVGYLGGRK